MTRFVKFYFAHRRVPRYGLGRIRHPCLFLNYKCLLVLNGQKPRQVIKILIRFGYVIS